MRKSVAAAMRRGGLPAIVSPREGRPRDRFDGHPFARVGGGLVRICLVLEAGGGGAGRHVLDLARELPLRGHAVAVIYSAMRAEARFLVELLSLPVTRVEVPMTRNPGPQDVMAVCRLAEALRQHGPFDIVHSHSSKAGALARLVPTGTACRIYTPHAFRALDPEASWLSKAVLTAIERMLGRARTDALIAVSQGELAFARAQRIAPGRCHLIRNGVIHPRSVDRAAVRRELRFAEDQLVVGFVGRLSYQKAPERFVEAMVQAMYARDDVRAVMIGQGAYESMVANAIERSGLAGRFRLLGGADAQNYIGAFDVLMMTSRYEGLSYVMLESLAAGVPIISTDVAGAHDVIVESGREGLIVGGADLINNLAGAVLGLAEDRERLRQMQEAARARGAVLNGQRMIDETEALYRRIAAEKRRG